MRLDKKDDKISLEDVLLEQKRRDLHAEMARRTFADFVAYTHGAYHHSEFSRAVCSELDRFLQAVVNGQRPVLILQAPPQHGKSELVSRRFPAYIFGRYPDLRIAACSYAADLARDMNRDVQRIMLDDKYAKLFPEIALNPKRVVTIEGQALRNSDRFDIPGHRGYYVCAGVGGPLTGKSVDIGIIDDPIKNEEEARSPAIKRKIQAWYETVFLTRLSKFSGHIIMATRWAVDDLSGVVLKNNPAAKVLSYPAINANGEALVPELHPIDKLLETKAMLPPSQWSALYQQSPTLEGGNIFEEKWFKFWNIGNLPDFFDEIVHSWDLTFKDSASADFAVGQVWGRKGVSYYLLHQIRSRMSYTAARESILTMALQYPNRAGILIEDKANGPAVMDDLAKDLNDMLPVLPYGSKVARAYAVTPVFRTGNVFIPEDKIAFSWVNDYITEMISFPAGGNDDQVDATTQAITYLKSHGLAVWESLANG